MWWIVCWEKVLFKNLPEKFEMYLLERFEKESIFFLNKYASKIWFSYQKLIIKTFKTKWGSCSSHQNIALNFKLVHLPIKFLEYVNELSQNNDIYMMKTVLKSIIDKVFNFKDPK